MLLLILVLGLALRLYRLEEMAMYNFDQEFVTNFVLDVVRDYPIRYIGQGLSVQGLFMGAWYFYAVIPGYLLTGLNPIGGFVFSVMIGMLITFGYYYVSKDIFSSKVAGLVAAFIRAISFYTIDADWTMVPSYSSDLLVLVVIYCLHKIYQKKDFYFYPLALTFGLFSSFHPIQFPFYFVFLVLLLIWKRKFSIKTGGISALLFILPSIPLIFFDFIRKWAMSKVILDLVFSEKSEESAEATESALSKFSGVLQMVADFFGQILHIPSSQKLITNILLILFIILLVWLLRKVKNAGFHFPVLITTFSVFILCYAFFPTHVPEYYLGALRVFFIIYIGYVLSHFLKIKKLSLMAIIVLFYISVSNAQSYYNRLTTPNLVTLYHKRVIVQKIIEMSKGEEFAVSYITAPGWGSGFQSLFRVYNRESSGKGPVFSIVSPLEVLREDEIDFTSGAVGLVYPDGYVEE